MRIQFRNSYGFIALIVVLLAAIPARADNNGLASGVFSLDAVAFGRTYGDWSAAWWQWALSIPADAHPLLDTADCTTGQSGPVFFLGGSFASSSVTRSCTVPPGKSLFFPVVNQISASFPPPLVVINDMRASDAQLMDAATDLHVDLDGNQLESINPNFRTQSAGFDVTLPSKNLFGIKAGTYSVAIDDGYYVMLRPLSAGPHTLHFKGTTSISLDVTYNLTQQ